MLTDQTQLTTKRNWLLGGSLTEFKHTQAIQPAQLSDLTHKLLKSLKVLLSESPNNAELINLKGRERTQTVLAELPPPNDQEVISINGEIAVSPSQESQSDAWEPFSVTCQTNFKRFEGAHSIVFTPHLLVSRAIPEWYPWWLVGAGAPIRLKQLRVGLELFTSKFALTRLSFMPIVTETLLIDATETTLGIKLTTEQPRARPSNPFITNPILASVSEAIASATGSTPSQLFQERLS
jgi:hypothetical protein